MKRLLLCLSIFSTSCSVQIPNIRVCASSVLQAGAVCGYTLTDETEKMTFKELIDFLQAAPPQYDEQGNIIVPGKPAALLISVSDFTRYKTAFQEACVHVRCTKEVEAEIERVVAHMDSLLERVLTPQVVPLIPPEARSESSL